MPRKSAISLKEARRIAYEAAASIINGALQEGFFAGLAHGYDDESIEGQRIQRALTTIAGQLEHKASP